MNAKTLANNMNPGWHALRYSEGRDCPHATGTPFGVPQGVPPICNSQ